MIIGATTTWNNIDMVETCLRHYRRLGLDQLLVMDFGSSDGTLDVLESRKWAGFVRQVPFPGIRLLDSSNLFLQLARKEYPSDTLALFFDPDELLVTPSMTASDLAGIQRADPWGGCVIHRFNVTATLEQARSSQDRMHPLGGLDLQILRRVRRRGQEDMHRQTLEPPWIWTAIPGKVLVKLECAAAIGDGDHNARLTRGVLSEGEDGFYLLHYPFRSWAEFSAKIDVARIDMAANADHLPETYGWQIKRWIRLADEGRLHQEYLHQFVPDEDLGELLDIDAIVQNDRVRSFHATAG